MNNENIISSNLPSKDKNIEWLVNKMDHLLDSYHNQLNANKEKFEKIYDKEISEMTGKRNQFLSIVGGIAGVLLTSWMTTLAQPDTFNGFIQSSLTIGIFENNKTI